MVRAPVEYAMLKRNAVTVRFLISVALMIVSSAAVAQVVPPARELIDANTRGRSPC